MKNWTGTTAFYSISVWYFEQKTSTPNIHGWKSLLLNRLQCFTNRLIIIFFQLVLGRCEHFSRPIKHFIAIENSRTSAVLRFNTAKKINRRFFKKIIFVFRRSLSVACFVICFQGVELISYPSPWSVLLQSITLSRRYYQK